MKANMVESENVDLEDFENLSEESLEAVKDQMKIIGSIIKPVDGEVGKILIYNMFERNRITMLSDERSAEFVDLLDHNGFSKWYKSLCEHIDNAADIYYLFNMVHDSYYLTWLKFVKPYLTIELFSKLLQTCWTIEEDPNQDANVSISMAIKWFREAVPEYLMESDDLETFMDVEDEITLYRGVSVGRAKYGLSWTDDLEEARWFKRRFEVDSVKGCILKSMVPKSLLLAYFSVRDESEWVVDVNRLKRMGKIEVLKE